AGRYPVIQDRMQNGNDGGPRTVDEVPAGTGDRQVQLVRTLARPLPDSAPACVRISRRLMQCHEVRPRVAMLAVASHRRDVDGIKGGVGWRAQRSPASEHGLAL